MDSLEIYFCMSNKRKFLSKDPLTFAPPIHWSEKDRAACLCRIHRLLEADRG